MPAQGCFHRPLFYSFILLRYPMELHSHCHARAASSLTCRRLGLTSQKRSSLGTLIAKGATKSSRRSINRRCVRAIPPPWLARASVMTWLSQVSDQHCASTSATPASCNQPGHPTPKPTACSSVCPASYSGADSVFAKSGEHTGSRCSSPSGCISTPVHSPFP